MLKIIISAILCMMPIVYFKQIKPEYSFLLRIAVIIFVLVACVSGIDFIAQTALSKFNVSDKTDVYIKIAVKVLGISLLTQTACDICRDCGENAVSTVVETVGKVFIVILTLPIIESLFEFSMSLLS